jgi:purine-binding chemotaxis protein CheW
MIRRHDSGTSALVVRAGNRRAALPLTAVGETMRPLPIEPLPGTPIFVSGMTVVRAEPVPVLNLEVLLGGPQGGTVERFVTVYSKAGTFMLGVAEVLGIRELPVDKLRELPGLLGAEASSVALAVAGQDERLVTLLDTARLVPDHVWQALHAHGAAT